MRVKRFINDSKVVISFILGIMLTATVCYGTSQLESSSVSYTKQGGELTTVKGALDELIGKSLIRIDELETKGKVYKYAKLADVANVGDYVAYDAGEWNQTVDLPAKQGDFGGYKANTSKNESVACYEDTIPKLKGWRVLKNDGSKVTLVHAGQPECYYHTINPTNTTPSVKALDSRATLQYMNSYAESAHAMTYAEAYDITGEIAPTDNDLRTIGTRYYLATPFEGSDGTLWRVYTGGTIYRTGDDAAGFRPVIVLKTNVFTTGRGKDQVGNENAWILA